MHIVEYTLFHMPNVGWSAPPTGLPYIDALPCVASALLLHFLAAHGEGASVTGSIVGPFKTHQLLLEPRLAGSPLPAAYRLARQT